MSNPWKLAFVICLCSCLTDPASAIWKANVDLRLVESDESFLFLAAQTLGSSKSHARLISFDPVRRGPAAALELPQLAGPAALALGRAQGATVLLVADSAGRAALIRADASGQLELLDQSDFSAQLGGKPPVAANSMLGPSHFAIAAADRLLFLPWDIRLRPLYTASIRPPGAITDLEHVQARYVNFDRGPLGLVEGRFLRPVDIPGPNQTIELASAPRMLGEVFRIDRSNDTHYFFIDGVKRYYYAYVTNTNVRQPFFEVDLGGVAYDLAVHDPGSRQVAFLVTADTQPEQSLVLGGGFAETGLSFETIGSAAAAARPFVSLFPTHLTRPEDRIHVRVEIPETASTIAPQVRIRSPEGRVWNISDQLRPLSSGSGRSIAVSEWQIDPASLGQPSFELEVSYRLPDGTVLSDAQEYILPWLYPATH